MTTPKLKDVKDWVQTFTGHVFPTHDFKPENFIIDDIAHALALSCRFNGHCLQFYSVAQHSVMVAHAVPKEHALWGLLHDASEAYLGDLLAPFKVNMPEYRAVEKKLMRAICQRFDLPREVPYCVQLADRVLLATEVRDLLNMPPKDWVSLEDIKPLEDKIEPWTWRKAEEAFLLCFEKLYGGVNID